MAGDERIIPIGEIVSSSTTSLIAQCNRPASGPSVLPEPPVLGSMVSMRLFDTSSADAAELTEEVDPFVPRSNQTKTIPNHIFGLVSFVQTLSIDPSRRAVALGIATEDEMRRVQPQVFELMTTEFTIFVTAFSDRSGTLFHRLPPRPPRIHSFVYVCEEIQTRQLTDDFGYLRSVLGEPGRAVLTPVDDLAAAAIVAAWEAHGRDRDYLLSAGKAVLRFSSNDYDRFQSIMQRVAAGFD